MMSRDCGTCKHYNSYLDNSYLDKGNKNCVSCENGNTNWEPVETALNVQEGGQHYKSKAIQPIVYIHANNLGFCEGNVVKYITRHKDKNGIEDLKKAKHYIDLLIELEYKNE
jgi:hypothetical protein